MTADKLLEGLGVKVPDLSDKERLLLLHIVEEASEVIHAACEVVRYGKGSIIGDERITTLKNLGREVGNLELLLEIASHIGMISRLDVVEGRIQYRQKLEIATNGNAPILKALP